MDHFERKVNVYATLTTKDLEDHFKTRQRQVQFLKEGMQEYSMLYALTREPIFLEAFDTFRFLRGYNTHYNTEIIDNIIAILQNEEHPRMAYQIVEKYKLIHKETLKSRHIANDLIILAKRKMVTITVDPTNYVNLYHIEKVEN